MNHSVFRFFFQNAPSLPFIKWCKQFDEKTKERDVKNFLFADRTIANACFIRSIISNKFFLNVFLSDNMPEELSLIEDNIKKHCESLLIKGAFSECKLDFCSEKHNDLVLRDYTKINLKEVLDESWQFYFKNKPNSFYKLSEYYNNLPFSYIWSFFFSEKNAEALVLDPFVKRNTYLFEKNIKLQHDLEDNKKYKIIYLDTMGKRININDFLTRVEQNGLLLLKNLDVEGPNIVGWRDLRGKMLGILKV